MSLLSLADDSLPDRLIVTAICDAHHGAFGRSWIKLGLIGADGWQTVPLGVLVTKLKDVEHLLRLAAVFLLVIVLFLALRTYFVPHSFGQYGHYRADAVGEISAKPVRFAGHQACEACHDDVLQVKQAGPHARVNCEACHGPQSAHADDPGSIKPQLPDTAVLCARCHEANIAKPKAFPQVVSLDHSGGETCKTCHVPHNPKQMPGDKKK